MIMFAFSHPGGPIKALALYTTIYPGVEPYLGTGIALWWNRRIRTSSYG